MAIVGRDYARVGTTVYGYQIEGMLDHTPAIPIGDAEVRAIGLFATGDPAVDSQVLLPRMVAERLLRRTGHATGFYVQVDAPGNVEQVEHELRAALGEPVAITRGTR